MFKYAYLREDGCYDLYNVEPTTVTAAEYADMQKRKELEARKEQLIAERAVLDATLTAVITQLNELTPSTAQPTAEALTVADTAEPTPKRKW